MTQRLVRTERNVYVNLSTEILAFHEKRRELKLSAAARRVACEGGKKMRLPIKRAQLLQEKALYVKAAEGPAQSPTLYPATPGMLDKMRTIHPSPHSNDPISIIPLETFH